MPTECSQDSLDFASLGSRKVTAAFDGGAMTSNAGALLLRETDRAIRLSRQAAACFTDGRRQDRIEHSVETLLAQRIHGIALGYEDLNDHDELRHDPVLGLLSGKLEARRATCSVLAGKSTLNRLEHAPKTDDDRYRKLSVDEGAMKRLFVSVFLKAHATPPKRIILDLDATDDPIHGDQEGRFFHGYYKCYCYLPLYIFCGRDLLLSKLRPANIDASAGAKEEIAFIVAQIRDSWPNVDIWLRADSGFCREEMMAWCEAHGVHYVFGLARNERLEALIADELAEASAKARDSGKPERIFKELRYQTLKSWSRERRVVAKAEHLPKGKNPRFIVSSLTCEAIEAKELYEKIYCARGDMENRIKECQLDLFADRTSAGSLRANQLRLWLASLAYMLMTALRLDKTGTLTAGGARLAAVETAPGENADEVLKLAASLEQASHHVVASVIVASARSRGLTLEIPQSVKETLGSGLEGMIGSHRICAGSASLIFGSHKPPEWAVRALRRASWRSALCIFVAKDGLVIGALLLADELRKETPRAVQALRAAGVVRMVMVTGDRADAAETISAALDLDTVLADRSPSDKVEAVATERRLHPTVMVGDGINDAPALAAADVGIAMGARGATASSEAADVVILVDRLDRVAEAVEIARRTHRIARQSIIAGMALSGIAMLAAALGWLTPVAAALTQEAIDVLVILNALRALFSGQWPMLRPETAISPDSLRHDHGAMEQGLDRLREIADALDDAIGAKALTLIHEANAIVQQTIVQHERQDETTLFPSLSAHLPASLSGLAAMSRAHREIQHLGRLLMRLSTGLSEQDADRYLIRDAQRVIETIEALVRLHNAQEEDIYEHTMLA